MIGSLHCHWTPNALAGEISVGSWRSETIISLEGKKKFYPNQSTSDSKVLRFYELSARKKRHIVLLGKIKLGDGCKELRDGENENNENQ